MSEWNYSERDQLVTLLMDFLDSVSISYTTDTKMVEDFQDKLARLGEEVTQRQNMENGVTHNGDDH